MVSGWVLFALTVPAPVLFVAGFYAGKHHVRRLAVNGGEESYPDRMQAVVEKYRREHPTVVRDD